MRFVRGFDAEIIAALASKHPQIRCEAVLAAGAWELQDAFDSVAALIRSKKTDKLLLLAAIEAAPAFGRMRQVRYWLSCCSRQTRTSYWLRRKPWLWLRRCGHLLTTLRNSRTSRTTPSSSHASADSLALTSLFARDACLCKRPLLLGHLEAMRRSASESTSRAGRRTPTLRRVQCARYGASVTSPVIRVPLGMPGVDSSSCGSSGELKHDELGPFGELVFHGGQLQCVGDSAGVQHHVAVERDLRQRNILGFRFGVSRGEFRKARVWRYGTNMHEYRAGTRSRQSERPHERRPLGSPACA